MTKLKKAIVLYSKHRALYIPDLFKLSVAKFMYSFDNGKLPKQFNNYFFDITSVPKCQTRLVSLKKYRLLRIKMPLSQLSLKYTGPKIWSDIPKNV